MVDIVTSMMDNSVVYALLDLMETDVKLVFIKKTKAKTQIIENRLNISIAHTMRRSTLHSFGPVF